MWSGENLSKRESGKRGKNFSKPESGKNEQEIKNMTMQAEINSILFNLQLKQGQLKNAKNEYEKLNSQNIALKADLGSILQKLKDAKSELESTKQENHYFKTENDAIRTKKDFMVGELRYLEPSVMDAKKEYQKLKSDYKFLHEEIMKVTNELIQLKPESDDETNLENNSVLADIKNKLDEIQEKKSKLSFNDLLESYKPDSQNAKNFTNELITEIKKIKSAIKDSKENSN